MKIESVKDKLQKVFMKAERLTGKHLSLPILSHILLIAKKGALTVRATNLDMGVEYTIPVKVEKEGELAVPGTVLTSLISSLPSAKTVTLEARDGKLYVETALTQAVINGSGSEDFPTIPKPQGEWVTLDPKILIKGLRAVQYAGALGNLKPELGSVYVYPDDRELIFVATDSFRLAEKKVLLKKPLTIHAMLIPIRNAAELSKMLEDEEEEVKLYVGKGQCSIEAPHFSVTSRLVEGNFPDYRQIIPKESHSEAVCLKEDVANALKAATLFSDRFNQIHVTFDPKKKTCTLTTRNGDVGEGIISLSAALQGDHFEGNFNHRFLSDCLSSLSSDSITLRSGGEGRPLLIQGIGDSTFRYLVMPMNR